MTNRMDEAQLIAEFRENRSEDAFASLVRRHVDFVYATALRQVGDSGLAEEITQTVTHGYVLAPAEAQELGRRLNETEGVNLISAPRVTMVDGKQARISDLGPNRGVLGGRIGVSVDLIPRISADGQTVDMTVLAEMGERNIEPPAVDQFVLPPME